MTEKNTVWSLQPPAETVLTSWDMPKAMTGFISPAMKNHFSVRMKTRMLLTMVQSKIPGSLIWMGLFTLPMQHVS